MSRVVGDFVKVRETKLEEKLHFSAGSGLVAATDYQVTGDAARDRMFVGEVIDVGPGKPVAPLGLRWLKELTDHPQHGALISNEALSEAVQRFGMRSSAPPCRVGDIVITNLSSISYRMPAQPGCYLVRGNVIMALIDQESFRVGPVRDYALVRQNEDRTVAAISRSEIWMPTEGMSTDDSPVRKSTNIVASYGEVIDVGPGCWEDGQWKEPGCKRGELILYDASYATLPITVRGARMTLVASTQILDIVEEARGEETLTGPTTHDTVMQ